MRPRQQLKTGSSRITFTQCYSVCTATWSIQTPSAVMFYTSDGDRSRLRRLAVGAALRRIYMVRLLRRDQSRWSDWSERQMNL